MGSVVMPKPEPNTNAGDRPPETRRWFEHEVVRLMDRLYGTALRLTHDQDDAEDIVAEAVTRAWAKLDELRDRASFEGWLFHILNNAFISEWRRRQCRRKLQAEAEEVIPEGAEGAQFSLFQKLHQPFLLWWGNAEEQFLNSLLRDDIQRALDALPDAFRVTIVLVEIQGYTYEEAAQLLEVPMGTVRSRLSRGRSMLQKSLWEQGREAGLVAGRAATGQKEGRQS